MNPGMPPAAKAARTAPVADGLGVLADTIRRFREGQR
jgi:hypothetical protein